MISKLAQKQNYYNIWLVNITKPIIFQFFMHLTSFVVAILVKLHCFTSPFVHNLRPNQWFQSWSPERVGIADGPYWQNNQNCFRLFLWRPQVITRSKYDYGVLHYTVWQCFVFLLYLNSLARGKFEWKFWYLIFQISFVTYVWDISCEFAFRSMSLGRTDDTGSGNGLVPSGNRPLPEPMLTQIFVTIWRH